MAQTPATEDLYEGDGTQTVFALTFPYLSAAEVFVTVDGTNTPYTWLAGSTASVQLSAAPALGTVVRVFRNTKAFVPLHVFAGGVPFLPRYIDENNRQLLYVAQEAVNETAGTAAAALVVAEEAKEIAEDALELVVEALSDSAATLRTDLANPAMGVSLVAGALREGDAPRQFDAVDALSGVVGFRNGEQILLLGYHPGSTKGGGVLHWSSTKSKTLHNGGTVIDPDRAYPSDWSNLASVQAWFTGSVSGTGCWVREATAGVYLPTQFGAFGDGVINDQPAYNACAVAGGAGALIMFTPTTASYRMHWFYGYDNQRVVAYGARIDLFKLTGGPTVLAASGNNARYDGVWLNCLETNLPNVRTTFEDRSNAHWYKCRFEGFRDAAAPDLNNAWGVYMKRAINITLEHCQFENNSQNDVAILEGCKNINIISPYGAALNINIEPNNDTLPIRCVTISNGDIFKFLAQENSLVGNSGNNILVESCNVQNAYYDGAGLEFKNSRIQSINPQPDGVGRCYAGALRLNGAVSVGANLLRDPNLVSVSGTDTGSSWQVYTATLGPTVRYAGISSVHGRGLRMNPTNVSGTNSLKSESVAVVAGSKYLVAALTGANYPVGTAIIGIQLGIRWLTAASVDISNTICPLNKAAIPTAESGTTSAPVTLQSAVVVAPAGAAFAQVLIGSTLSSATTSSSDWYSVGLHPIVEGSSGCGMQDPMALHQAQRGALIGRGAAVPSASPTQFYYRDYLVGDRIINVSPVAAGYSGWLCTVAGTPGTWKGFGVIQA